jgi:ectoine hydroxylase-related dioxygenase (phytanoyl-CoA dioxygenase family)
MRFDLDRPYALGADQVAAFRRDGFIRLEQLFTIAELRHYGREITALVMARSERKAPLADRSTYGRAFLQVTNLWEQGGPAREFVFGQRLARVAAALLEVSGVRLYHDQALLKEPGGGLTPAHADQFYWPLASDRAITAWVPLQAVPREMGPIGYYAGSHEFEHGRNQPISDASERLVGAAMEQEAFALVDHSFALGEVAFHLGWTFHRAGPNATKRPRFAMTIIYIDQGMRLAPPVNAMQQLDQETWCPDAVVGEVIDTPKNPILFAS